MSEIICGDALDTLKTLPDGIVQTCVTSPPYYGLRDYGTAQWTGGSAECDHLDKPVATKAGFNERYFGKEYATDKQGETRHPFKAICGKCGATRQDQQIGLEDTPEAYIARLVEVFREVKRVLRDDGTLWVNIGDSYARQAGDDSTKATDSGLKTGRTGKSAMLFKSGCNTPPAGLKPKDLIGIPWMLAFALRADGWYLRSDIIWHKPNCMPESVEDRPTKAHEYIFLLSKSANYYYDNDAIREPHDTALTDKRRRVSIEEYEAAKVGRYIRKGEPELEKGRMSAKKEGYQYLGNPYGRNKRSVWTIATSPYSEAHFATFPPKLIEPCILAGTSPRACEHCGAPWERVTERIQFGKASSETKFDRTMQGGPLSGSRQAYRAMGLEGPPPPKTIGWQPTCTCSNTGSGSCVVLDPFAGAGTVPLVALKYQRAYIGIELNQSYIDLANKRIHTTQPVLWEVGA